MQGLGIMGLGPRRIREYVGFGVGGLGVREQGSGRGAFEGLGLKVFGVQGLGSDGSRFAVSGIRVYDVQALQV